MASTQATFSILMILTSALDDLLLDLKSPSTSTTSYSVERWFALDRMPRCDIFQLHTMMETRRNIQWMNCGKESSCSTRRNIINQGLMKMETSWFMLLHGMVTSTIISSIKCPTTTILICLRHEISLLLQKTWIWGFARRSGNMLLETALSLQNIAHASMTHTGDSQDGTCTQFSFIFVNPRRCLSFIHSGRKPDKHQHPVVRKRFSLHRHAFEQTRALRIHCFIIRRAWFKLPQSLLNLLLWIPTVQRRPVVLWSILVYLALCCTLIL